MTIVFITKTAEWATRLCLSTYKTKKLGTLNSQIEVQLENPNASMVAVISVTLHKEKENT